MNILTLLEEKYLCDANLNIGRQEQINKIRHYRDTNDFYNVCHAHTGKAIKKHPDSYVILCGMNKNMIAHSFVVDKHGVNLIPGDKSYIDMDNPTTCKIVHNGIIHEYPYVEVIKASNI